MYASQAEDLLFSIVQLQKNHDLKMWKRSQFTMISKYLRDAGLLPSGSRGNAAPHIDGSHLANLLIAMLAAEQPGHAPEAVITYSALRTSDGGWFDTSFGEFLTRVVCNPDLAQLIESVSLCRNFPRVTVVLQGNEGPKTLVFTKDNFPKEGGVFYLNAVMSGGFLAQLAGDAADPRMKFPAGDESDETTRGGWVSDDPQRHAEYKRRLAAHRAEAEHDE